LERDSQRVRQSCFAGISCALSIKRKAQNFHDIIIKGPQSGELSETESAKCSESGLK